NVAVIIVCHDQPDHLQRAAQCSADAMLLRPISPVQLMETVGRFLELEMVRSKRIDFSVEVQVADRNSGGELVCLSRDISKSGIRLESSSMLETGSRIVCRFSIPHAGAVDAEGHVVRHVRTDDGRNQFGVQFVDLSDASRRQIEAHVTRVAG
ncbi:MAG TPA: PilZ domain-containing protein, partial [Geobacteraceae bacterium]|nr:PilZ domain-containing protein [Geobacteraceae bacterium]